MSKFIPRKIKKAPTENTNIKRGDCSRCPHSSFGRYAFFCNYYKLEVGQFEPTCNNPDLMKQNYEQSK